MASFSFMSKYRTGYYLGVRSFLLRERRSIPDRIKHLSAEISRIGEITVEYQKVATANGGIKATEKRIGFKVTPNTTLEKLLRAYIVQGGNPLDISMFLVPDLNAQVQQTDDTPIVTKEKYPYGGVAYPLSQEQHATNDGPNAANSSVADMKIQEQGASESFGEYPGGYLNLIKYPPRRLGGRKDPDENASLNAIEFDDIRKWANAEIRYKLHDLEARIIKLCDLREQLKNELDSTLAQAWGGLLRGLETKWNETNYVRERRVPEMLVAMDKRMFQFKDEYAPSGENSLIPRRAAVNLQDWTYMDDPTENLLDLMP